MRDIDLKTVDKILQGKTFHYDGYFFEYEPQNSPKISFDYKVRVTGPLVLYHGGVPQDLINIKLEISNIEPKIFEGIFRRPMNTRQEVDDAIFTFIHGLRDDVSKVMKIFSIHNGVSISQIEVEDELETTPAPEKEQIKESKGERGNVIRKVARDILGIIKSGTEGEFYLPEDIEEEKFEYTFPNVKRGFAIEFKVTKDKTLQSFIMDGRYREDDDTILIVMLYNPDKMPQITYEILGELNDIIRHELEHLFQKERGTFRTARSMDPTKYYVTQNELDAQVAGIKRRARLSGEPFEDVLRKYFQKYKFIHGMKKKDAEKVIQKILKRYQGED